MENTRAEIIRKIARKIKACQEALDLIDRDLSDAKFAIDTGDSAVCWYLQKHCSPAIASMMTINPKNEYLANRFINELMEHLSSEKNRRQELIDMYTSTDYITTELEVLSQDLPDKNIDGGASVPQGEQNVQISS